MGEFEDNDSIVESNESSKAVLVSKTPSMTCIQQSVSNIPNYIDGVDCSNDEGDHDVKLTNGNVPNLKDDDQMNVPDGGIRAWTIMFSSFLCNGILLGIVNSYSVLYFYLVKQLEEAGDTESSSKVALVGSLTIGTMFFLSPIAGILIDRIGIRTTTFIGGFLASSGMFLSSFLTYNVDFLFLTYSIMYGFGASLAYTPSLVILGHYFKKFLGIANGFVTCGSSVFTVFVPIVLDVLISLKGLEVSLRIFSLLITCVMLCAFLFKPLESPDKLVKKVKQSNPFDIKKIINTDIWRNKKYIIWTTAIPVALFGYFVPYVHMYKFVKINFPQEDGKLPVMAIGITSGIGRLIFGYIADNPRVDKILLQQIAFISIGTMAILTPLSGDFKILIIISLVLGLFDGCFISILGPIAFELCGKDGASQAIGFVLGFCSIPLTVGPPIATLLYEHTGSYLLSFLLAGVPPFVGATYMCLVRYVGNPKNNGNDVERNCNEEESKNEDQNTEPLMNDKFRKSVSMKEVALASSESPTDVPEVLECNEYRSK